MGDPTDDPAPAASPPEAPASRGDTALPAPTNRRQQRRSEAAARRLPSWIGSIRVRMALLWSVVLFVLAGVVVAVIYLGLSSTLDEQAVTRQVVQRGFLPDGTPVVISREEVDPYLLIEREANARALETLRTYSAVSLLGLFGASVVVGWLVAGRLLRPVEEISSVARDITATDLARRIDLPGPPDELHDLADTFDDMLDRLDDAFEGQRRFIHEASHELRNPLAVTRTNVEVALSDPDAPVEDLRASLEVVQRSAERMSRLVDDLLVYARQGKLSLEEEPVDLAEMAAEAGDDFRAQAEAVDVALVVDAPVTACVRGDRHALRQALANLIANALRHAPAGTEVTLSAGVEGPWAWVAVADKGPGIAKEDQERVFQRFWRSDPAAGRAEGRSGLGLTIVRQIAEAHAGEVRLASAEGMGAAFALWIPRGDAGPADEPVT